MRQPKSKLIITHWKTPGLSPMRHLITALIFPVVSATALGQVQLEALTLEASDAQNFDLLAFSAAMDGELVILGAPGVSPTGPSMGAAYLFHAITGAELMKIESADTTSNDYFGRRVAIRGSTALIAAPLDDPSGSRSGSAYFFDTDSAELTKIVASDGAADDYFGESVAIDGGTALVAAPQDDDLGSNSGSVYVFDVVSGSEVRKLLASDGSPNDGFGSAVTVLGSLAAIGAPGDDDFGSSSGAVYLFDVNTGVELMKLTPNDAQGSMTFGGALSLSGSTLLVGASGDDTNGDNSGSAYLFDVNSGAQIAKLEPPQTGAGVRFGSKVALDGPTALVGAYLDSSTGLEGGAAHFFDASTGVHLKKLLASEGNGDDWFGFAVDISGPRAVVGAYHANFPNRGRALLFDTPSAPAQNSGQAYCFGDGTGATCPCGFFGDPGQGCNTSSNRGVFLTGAGNGSLSDDNFQLQVTGAPAQAVGLVLMGGVQLNGGLGSPAGDGLLCTSGQSRRSQVQVATVNSILFNDFKGDPFGVASYGSGLPTNYQFWFRDPFGPCTGLGFNFSNAWTVTWMP